MSRALDRRFTEEMPVEVEGETIEEEEFNDAGWNFVRGKSSKQGTAGREPDAGSRRYGGGFGAPSQRSRSTLKKRVIASSRMPDLPEDHRRIVIGPRDGLDLRKAGHCKVAEAIMAAAKITYDVAGEDVVCPNVTQNIVVVSTPLEKHAQNYVCIKQIKVGEKVYNVNAYYSAGDGYCKGVIWNVDREITEKELNTMIVHSRNPTAMQAKRIKDSGTVVIVFEGCEVPNYIKFGRVLLKCYLYRRQVDVCYICANVGHRADVCPTPEKKICRGCGVENPTDSHECKAKCKLCGKGHPTGDRTCTQRYQTPFLVRQRRRERIEESRRERQHPGRFQDFPAIEERGDQRRSQGATPRSESAGPGSRSTSGPGHLPPQATWAQKAGDVKAPQVSGGSPTGQPGSEELKQIREKNSLLKEMVMALKEEIGTLRKALEATNTPAPVAMETSEGPVGRKRKAVGDVAVSDKDGFESFRETMEKSLIEITSILQQLRVVVGELKKHSADHGKRLRTLEARADEVRVITPNEEGRTPLLPSPQPMVGADENSKSGSKNGGAK
ncbi:hypothetical protein HPB49_011827 [Dermacentor silvarum]|uniref:Uncharacterized protein n=1 Tax=Dermacentor silvarum TaxID=543639 RepID=A0ACB8DNZ4_DERSI|nr:hypothetical protein HPB49_011827 [Dermacentor silvarum]